VLQLRAAGMQYTEIAAQVRVPVDQVHADAIAELAARGLALEPASAADALALERLDTLERRAQTVLAGAAQSGQHDLALRAVDRLLVIHERRAAVLPLRPEPGEMERAVAAEVGAYAKEMRGSPAAVAAVLLARRLDAGLPAQDLPGVAREIRITLRVLADKAPQEKDASTRDDLRKRREDRLLAAAGGQ
jgi:hypothetical protein